MGFGPVRSATCGARTLISPTAASGLHGSKGASRQNNRYCHKNSASGLFRKSTSKHSIYPPKESPMERRFDLVVIGTGVASAVASRCREAGWTVAVVDYRPFGGTCALRGCIPKKILVSAAEAVHGARTMADRGVRPGEGSIDWPDLIRVKRSVTDPVAAQAGAQITILHRGPRPLEAFDPDLVDLLVKRTRELGMAVELSTEVRGVERNGGGCTVRATREGREQRFAADLVVHGAGRIPELDDLDLEAAGVKREARGVTVNQYLQSVSNPAVYAARDAAASGPPLTPVASHHVDVVTTNLLQGNRVTPNYEGLPPAVFTIPPLASAGLSEAAARQTGLKFRSHWQGPSQWLSTPPLGPTK